MHEYDVALKLLLRAAADSILKQINIQERVVRWLDVEFPRVQSPRADLLGVTGEGDLIHIELQSFNDPDMALRMAEYLLAIYRRFRKWPKQILLYVGEPKLTMKTALSSSEFDHPDFVFRYLAVDFRQLEGAALLESEGVADNVLAILARLRDQKGAIRQILERIARLGEPERQAVLTQFLIISGLRRLGRTIQEEATTMPVLNDILSHDLLGPAILQGRQEIIRRLVEKRFGSVPLSVEQRLVALSAPELDDLAVRLLDVPKLDDLFPPGASTSQ